MDETELQKAIVRSVEGLSGINAALKLGVDVTTISLINNGRWSKITDKLLNNLSVKIGYEHSDWVVVDTKCKRIITEAFDNAKNYSMVFGVVADAGRGKTQTAKLYKRDNPNVILLKCSEYWNRKTFACELMRALGKNSGSWSVTELMDMVITEIKLRDKPLIILDEADKLSDQVFYFFITLYNLLEDRCGIVMCGTSYLEKKVIRGVAHNKKGYEEIFSRIGRRFVVVPKNTDKELDSICRANGITDELVITEIRNESEGDIRRIKRKVHAEKL